MASHLALKSLVFYSHRPLTHSTCSCFKTLKCLQSSKLTVQQSQGFTKDYEPAAPPHKARSCWARPAPGCGTAAPSSPEAVVGVGLIVLYPHVVLLRSGCPLLRSPRVRPGQHVRGHLRGCGRARRQSGRGPRRRPQPGRGGRAVLPPGPRNHRPVAPYTPAPPPAPRSSVRLPAHPPAPPKAPPRRPGPP